MHVNVYEFELQHNTLLPQQGSWFALSSLALFFYVIFCVCNNDQVYL